MRLVSARLLLSLLASVTLFGSATAAAQEYPKDSRPQLFSYDELVLLGSDQPLSPALADKLHRLTTTPFINNEAYQRGARPRPLDVPGLGPTLRVALWNIERGLELDDIQRLLTDSDRFMARVKEEREHARKAGKRVRQVMLETLPQQIETLRAADVWILNEVDWGVKRTGYREIVRELAETMNMNWAYGVEFLEVDAVSCLRSSKSIRSVCARCTAMPYCRVTRSVRPGWCHSQLATTGSPRAGSGRSRRENARPPSSSARNCCARSGAGNGPHFWWSSTCPQSPAMS